MGSSMTCKQQYCCGNRYNCTGPEDPPLPEAALSSQREEAVPAFDPMNGGCPQALHPSPTPVSAPVGDRPTGHVTIAHDGFSGEIIGHYVTREGKPGVVVQQDSTRVVHVYGEKWLNTALRSPAVEGE
jgi:hypothetical protein